MVRGLVVERIWLTEVVRGAWLVAVVVERCVATAAGRIRIVLGAIVDWVSVVVSAVRDRTVVVSQVIVQGMFGHGVCSLL